MAYSPTTWVDNVTQGNHTTMNHLETQYTEAILSYNEDFFGAGWVLTGLVCTKDGSVVNQLDVTAGAAYLFQAVDSSFRNQRPTATTFTTSTPSTTYYLDLNPDASWSWGTAHSAQTGHLTICSVTTDASGNILVVTDTRQMGFTLFPSMTGLLQFPSQFAATDTISPLQGFLSSAPGSDTPVIFGAVIGDGTHRTQLYIRSDGYGGFSAGAGGVSAVTAHLYAQSDGWHCAGTENITIGGNFVGAVATAIPTTRLVAGTPTSFSVPIYTGYTGGANPSNPPTGSIRIDA